MAEAPIGTPLASLLDLDPDLGGAQVLANLLSNAGTHTPAGTTVTVELGVAADHGVLRTRPRS